jgi:DNA-binding XRE family transcriptional regulator
MKRRADAVQPQCRRCKTPIRSRELKRYHYRESGLDNVYLGGVTIEACPSCGLDLLIVPREQQVLQVIALVLLSKPLGLSGPEMKYLRTICRLTQADLAARLGLGRRETVAERETEAVAMTREADFWFRAVILGRFTEILAEPKRCFLTPAHRRHLRALKSRFLELPRKKPCRRKVLSLEPSEDGWKIPDAA